MLRFLDSRTKRDNEKPFLMPIEDVFTITGRGTVATGRIETGVANTGDAVDIIGMGAEKLGINNYWSRNV